MYSSLTVHFDPKVLSEINFRPSKMNLNSENNQSRVVLSNSNVTIRGFLPLLEYAYTSVLKVNQSDVTDCFLAAVHLHMQSISDYLR